MSDETEFLAETPEEKAFFDSKGVEQVETKPETKTEPELPLEQKPEAVEPAKTEEPEGEASNKVPLAALLAERREAKAKYDKMMARIEKLQELIQPKQENLPPADPEVDPIRALKEARAELNQIKSAQQSQAEIQAVHSFAKTHADAFRQQTPDFDDAYNHLRVSRANQLIESGMIETQEQLAETLLNEEKALIQMAANWRVSPAALVYNLARSAGYSPQQTQEAAAEVKETPQKPQEVSAAEKIKMAAEAQKRAANPVSSAGSSGNGRIDLKAILQMDDSDFDKETSGENWRKLMGG